MPIQRYFPADLAAMQSAVQSWIAETLRRFDELRWGDVDDSTLPRAGAVYRENQNAPAGSPALSVYPFAVWKMGPPIREGESYLSTEEFSTTVADEVVEHDARIALSINVFEAGSPEESIRSALPAAAYLEASSRSPSIRDVLSAEGVAIVSSSPPSDLTRIAGARFESRFLVELVLRVRVRHVVEDVDWIDPSLSPVASLIDGTTVNGTVGV